VNISATTALPQRTKMQHHPPMKNRFALLVAPMMLALTAAAPSPKQAPVPDTVRVAIATEAGAIVVELDGKHAPVTTGNFLRYADEKRFDGTTFYRSMHLAWGDPPNGLIQAGTQNDPKRYCRPSRMKRPA